MTCPRFPSSDCYAVFPFMVHHNKKHASLIMFYIGWFQIRHFPDVSMKSTLIRATFSGKKDLFKVKKAQAVYLERGPLTWISSLNAKTNLTFIYRLFLHLSPQILGHLHSLRLVIRQLPSQFFIIQYLVSHVNLTLDFY